MVQQRLEHRRHAGQRRRLDPLHRRQHLRRIEARQHHHLAAIHHRPVERAGIGEDMEEGQHRNDPVRLIGVRINRLRLPRIGGQILVGQHRPLGRARRPAGILQQRDVVDRVDLRHGTTARIGDQTVVADDARIVRQRRGLAGLEPAEQQRFDRRQHLRHRPDDQRLQRAMLQHLQRGGQQRLGRQGEEDFRAAVGDLMLQFGCGIEGGEVNDDRAGHQRAIIGRDIMGSVGQIKADPVALAHAHFLQAAGDPADLLQHRAIAEMPPHEVDHRRVGMRRGAVRDHVPHRQRGECLVPDRGVLVAFSPDFFYALHARSVWA